MTRKASTGGSAGRRTTAAAIDRAAVGGTDAPPADGAEDRRRSLRRTAKTSERVAGDIVRDIVARGLHEGDRLPTETVMLQEFEVGRASLREALRILEVNGLITIKPGPGGGPVVGTVDPIDLGRTLSFYFHLGGGTFRELVQARLILEPVMARLAAERQDPEVRHRIEAVLERENAASLADPEYIRSANDFHHTLSGVSGNRVLDIVGRALKALFTDRVSERGLVPAEARPAIRRAHKQVAEAILGGNARRAEQLMRSHMEEYVAFVEKRQPALLDEVVSWD